VPYWFDLKVYSNQTYALIPLWLALCGFLPLELRLVTFLAIRFHSEVFRFSNNSSSLVKGLSDLRFYVYYYIMVLGLPWF
jgi:hypothetical protein